MAKSRFRYDATLTQPGAEYLRFRGGKPMSVRVCDWMLASLWLLSGAVFVTAFF